MTENKKERNRVFENKEITLNGEGISFALEIFIDNCPRPFLYHRPSKPHKTWSPYNKRNRSSKVRKIDPSTIKIEIFL